MGKRRGRARKRSDIALLTLLATACMAVFLGLSASPAAARFCGGAYDFAVRDTEGNWVEGRSEYNFGPGLGEATVWDDVVEARVSVLSDCAQPGFSAGTVTIRPAGYVFAVSLEPPPGGRETAYATLPRSVLEPILAEGGTGSFLAGIEGGFPSGWNLCNCTYQSRSFRLTVVPRPAPTTAPPDTFPPTSLDQSSTVPPPEPSTTITPPTTTELPTTSVIPAAPPANPVTTSAPTTSSSTSTVDPLTTSTTEPTAPVTAEQGRGSGLLLAAGIAGPPVLAGGAAITLATRRRRLTNPDDHIVAATMHDAD